MLEKRGVIEDGRTPEAPDGDLESHPIKTAADAMSERKPVVDQDLEQPSE